MFCLRWALCCMTILHFRPRCSFAFLPPRFLRAWRYGRGVERRPRESKAFRKIKKIQENSKSRSPAGDGIMRIAASTTVSTAKGPARLSQTQINKQVMDCQLQQVYYSVGTTHTHTPAHGTADNLRLTVSKHSAKAAIDGETHCNQGP